MVSTAGKGTRRHGRIKAVLPVQVGGNDAFGNAFQEIAHTLDITPTGVRLGAIHHELKVRDELTIQYRNRRLVFHVVWTKLLEGQVNTMLDCKEEAVLSLPGLVPMRSGNLTSKACSILPPTPTLESSTRSHNSRTCA